jgi:transcriptional regulator with XRE-family HTH domain
VLNKALRLVRVFHDLSVTELAERLNLSKSYISELERGQKKVSLDVLQRYSEHFKIPMSSLMLFAERTSNPDPPEKARLFVAEKVVKMLDWLATISEEQRD